jgi:hypothetical protein
VLDEKEEDIADIGQLFVVVGGICARIGWRRGEGGQGLLDPPRAELRASQQNAGPQRAGF